jgi:hypothetical protein
MLGTFLAEDPLDVPGQVLEFVAEQLGIDPVCAPEYLTRPKTAYEHAWEIRDLLELSEFSKREQEVRDYLAARVWSTIEGPRALFDRAVVPMLREGILLPAGIITLMRLISEVRRAEHARLYRTLGERAGPELRARLAELLQFIADEGYRRMIGTQLNVQEARHRLARKIAFGNRGQLRQRYREGLEDQLGSLGLALNAVIWWNSLYGVSGRCGQAPARAGVRGH